MQTATQQSGLGAGSRPGWLQGAGAWLAPAAMVFAVAFVVFGLRLHYTLTHILVSNCILGGDNAMIGAGGSGGRYALIARGRHMLAYLSLAAVNEFVHLFLKPRLASFNVALALAAALTFAQFFVFLVRRSVSRLTAAAATLFAASSFSVLTIFSIAETYAVTGAAIAFALLVIGETAPLADRKPWLVGAVTGLAVGVAGLANGPLALMVLILPILTFDRARDGAALKDMVRFGLARLVLPSVIAMAFSAAPPVLFSPPNPGYRTSDFLSEYLSLGHILDPATLGRYLTNLVAFTWVSPLPLAQSTYPAEAFGALASSPLRLAALAATLALTVGALVLACKPAPAGAEPAGPSRRRWILALLAVCAGLWAFYAVFNPTEVLLYAVQWVLPVSAVVALGICRQGRLGALALLACAVLNLSVNWSAALYPIDRMATVCPQNGMKVDAAMEAVARTVAPR